MDWAESAEAIAEVDELLAQVGLDHGRRKTRAGAGKRGERQSPASKSALEPPKKARQAAGRMVPVVRAVGWEKYPWLRHGFSTRAGGVSTIYGPISGHGSLNSLNSLNLGWTQQDDPANVVRNRSRFLGEVVLSQTAGGAAAHLVTLRQIHSGLIRTVETDDAADHGLQTPDGRALLRGDGLMTNAPGVVLAIQVADCVPVLVADVRRRMAGGSQIIAEIAAPAEALRAAFENLLAVEQFDISAIDGEFFRCALTPRDGCDLRPAVFSLARENGWTLRELTRSRHSLEDIYVQVTKPKTEEQE